MKILIWIGIIVIAAGVGYTSWQVQGLQKELNNLQSIEKARYRFLTSLHIYALQERETLDILSKLTYARLNRLEGARDIEGTIRKLDEQYEKAQSTTEQEWELLKKNHPEEAREFALQYEQWLRQRALASPGDAKK